jgi:hypothetical protein
MIRITAIRCEEPLAENEQLHQLDETTNQVELASYVAATLSRYSLLLQTNSHPHCAADIIQDLAACIPTASALAITCWAHEADEFTRWQSRRIALRLRHEGWTVHTTSGLGLAQTPLHAFTSTTFDSLGHMPRHFIAWGNVPSAELMCTGPLAPTLADYSTRRAMAPSSQFLRSVEIAQIGIAYLFHVAPESPRLVILDPRTICTSLHRALNVAPPSR